MITVVTTNSERIVLSDNNVTVYEPTTSNVITYDMTSLPPTASPPSRRLLQDIVRAQVFVTACGKLQRGASVTTNRAGPGPLAEGPVGTFRGSVEKPESNADVCNLVRM